MIRDIAKRLSFPDEAIDYLCDCYRKMEAASSKKIKEAEESLYTPKDERYMALLAEISEESSIERYACDMAFMLKCAISLIDKYRRVGYSDLLFDETMADLRFKLFECKEVFNTWGTFVTPWFKGFYLLERFKLGRMQYERIEFPFEGYKGVVNKGDIVLSCHIPSDGPMLVDDVKKSLRQAYEFYKNDRKDGKLAVMCFSWLLYSPIFENYKDGSNIKNFYNLFDVIENKPNERNSDFWRVFRLRYSPEILDSVTVDNSLKRAIIDHLKSGGSMGSGSGIIIVDENY